MRRIILYSLSVFLLSSSCSHDPKTVSSPREQGIDTIPMLIMQVQECSRLYTAEYNIHKIVTHDDVMRLKGSILSHRFDIPMPVGDRKIAIPIDATLKAYIDLSGFSEANIRRDGSRLTIILPDPKVVLTSSKIDQKGIKEFVSLTRSRFSDAEMTAYEQQGRASIIASIPRIGIIGTARENAACILIPMMVQMGWREQDVTVTFRKEFGDDDLGVIVDGTDPERRTR